jgi:hypothetical protein
MSFYSALVLAANTELRSPTPEKARSLFEDLGLLRPDVPEYGVEHGLDNLATYIAALFDDRAAQNANNHFFTPDSIGLFEGVQVEGPDCGYTGKDGRCAFMEMAISSRGISTPFEFGLSQTRSSSGCGSPCASSLAVGFVGHSGNGPCATG